MVMRLERKDQMSKCGEVGTYLRCSEGYSNCEDQDTQDPCTQYTLLVPIPPRGSPDPSSRAKHDPVLLPSSLSLQWDPGSCMWTALCP